MEPLTFGESSNYIVHPKYRGERGREGEGEEIKEGGEEIMMKYLQEGSKSETLEPDICYRLYEKIQASAVDHGQTCQPLENVHSKIGVFLFVCFKKLHFSPCLL